MGRVVNFREPGLLLIDKPAGPSSSSLVRQVGYKLKAQKIGHAGTLDPMASGLLVVLLNSATRLQDFILTGNKGYSGTFRLGIKTDSDDITGKVIETSQLLPDVSKVLSEAPSFVGSIMQTPPALSAIKVEGQRSYDRFRRGEQVELKARCVNIFSFKLTPLAERAEFSFELECSKGTYVRALVRDLGERLGCGATLTSLRRTYSAPFNVANAKAPEQIELGDILPIDALFPCAQLEPQYAELLKRGDQKVLESEQLQSKLSGFGADRLFYSSAREPLRCLGLLVRAPAGFELSMNL